MSYFKPTSVQRPWSVVLLSISSSALFGGLVGHFADLALPWMIPVLLVGATAIYSLVCRVNPYSAIAEFWRLPRDIKEFERQMKDAAQRVESREF